MTVRPQEGFMSRSVAALAGISFVMVLIAFDQTVVGTALPRMVSELQGFDLYPWVAAAYLLGNAILIPVTGRLGDLHGRKPYLLAAIALFTLASALCGMADSMLQLVLARALQGIGGGMLVGSAFAAVSDLFPDILERVRWHVMLSAAFGVASALGPALGGWMTEHLGWRSVFYVNLPVGLIALPMVWRNLPRMVHGDKPGKALDWLGVLLLTLAIGMLLMTTELGERLGFSSAPFWGLVALSLLLGGLFLRHQHRTPAPIIPPHLFADTTVRRLALLAALTGLIMFVLLFYAPLLLQGGFSLSPNEAGLVVTPLLVSLTMGSVVNGHLIPRLARPERLFSHGVLLLIIGMGILSVVSTTTPTHLLMVVFALCGFSLGFQLPNLTLQIQSVVSREDQGAASALIQTFAHPRQHVRRQSGGPGGEPGFQPRGGANAGPGRHRGCAGVAPVRQSPIVAARCRPGAPDGPGTPPGFRCRDIAGAGPPWPRHGSPRSLSGLSVAGCDQLFRQPPATPFRPPPAEHRDG
jgi:EmrB/QacA subfamily drug resistance transporter